MKILYLTDQTYLHGGIEKVLSQKANYLGEEMDDEVTIVTYNQKGNPSCYSFSSRIKFIDLGVDYITGKSYFNLDNLKKIPEHRASLQRVLKKIKPDVIISCSFGPDFYFLPFMEKKIPKIKEFHSSRFFLKQNPAEKSISLKYRLIYWIEKRYHSIVVLNKSEVGFYSNNNIKVIPNPAEISGERADLSKKRILAAGRVAPVKNFGELIQAFALVSEDFPDWELHFFGDDYNGTQAELEKKIKFYGLENQIKFKGITENLKNEMQNYSIFAMTSETECFPMVLLEALSVGLPIITYDSPTGPRHIVTHDEDAILVPYKNLPIFAEKLKVLMNDIYLRKDMGEKGVTKANHFNIDKVMQKWKQLFNRLLFILF